jgi:hypothetical protein
LTNGYFLDNADFIDRLHDVKGTKVYKYKQEICGQKIQQTNFRFEMSADGHRKKLEHYINGIHRIYQDDDLFQKITFILGAKDGVDVFWKSIENYRDKYNIKTISDSIIKIAGRAVLIDDRGNAKGWDYNGTRSDLPKENYFLLFPDNYESGRPDSMVIQFFPNKRFVYKRFENIIYENTYMRPDGAYKSIDEIIREIINASVKMFNDYDNAKTKLLQKKQQMHARYAK